MILGNVDVIKLLLRCGADITIRNDGNETVFQVAGRSNPKAKNIVLKVQPDDCIFLIDLSIKLLVFVGTLFLEEKNCLLAWFWTSSTCGRLPTKHSAACAYRHLQIYSRYVVGCLLYISVYIQLQ